LSISVANTKVLGIQIFDSVYCIWKCWYIFVGWFTWDFEPNHSLHCKASTEKPQWCWRHIPGVAKPRLFELSEKLCLLL